MLSFRWLPIPIALVLLGLVVRATLGKVVGLTLDPAMLAYFLPALIFEAAWDFDSGLLRRTMVAIGMLAVPGVLVTIAIVALGVVLTHEMTWTAALLLGAIVAATDPVAVVALFRRVHMPGELLAIIEGESVVNDGVAVVVTQAFLPLALGGNVTDGILAVSAGILWVSLGGVLIGAIAALALAVLLRRVGILWVRVALTIVLAYGTYAVATATGVSGIFATAVAGLAAPALAGFSKDDNARRLIENFWDAVAFIANGAVFFLVGLNISFGGILHAPLVPAAALGATVGARFFLAYGLVPLRSLVKPSRTWRHAIALAGLRGGLSLALALGLPRQLPQRETIISAVFAIVSVTLVVQGSLIGPLLRRLRF